MSSPLRYHSCPDAIESPSHTVRRTSPPTKKQKMSLSQSYLVAGTARTKLGREACRPDHNLRLLVGHANLLDSLMFELHQAEREQDAWFTETVQKAAKKEEPKQVEWIGTVDEPMDEDEEMEDASSDDDEEFTMLSPRRTSDVPTTLTTTEMTEYEDEDDFYDDEYNDAHALVSTATVTSPTQSPPELVYDLESDDECSPTTPPRPSFPDFSDAQKHAIATTEFFDRQAKPLTGTAEIDFVENGYYLPARIEAVPLVAAF